MQYRIPWILMTLLICQSHLAAVYIIDTGSIELS